jgi:hypothetical protein
LCRSLHRFADRGGLRHICLRRCVVDGGHHRRDGLRSRLLGSRLLRSRLLRGLGSRLLGSRLLRSRLLRGLGSRLLRSRLLRGLGSRLLLRRRIAWWHRRTLPGYRFLGRRDRLVWF